MKKTLLVFQTAYTYAQMQEKDMIDFFTSKDLDGYFDKVITANGFGRYTENSELNGRPLVIKHDENHIYIEATNSKSIDAQKFPFINFVFAQIRFIQFIRKLLKSSEINIIRAEDPRYNGILGFLFSSRRGLPLVVGNWGNPDTIRQLTGRPMSPRLFRNINIEKRIERFVFRKADLCIAQNSDNLEYISQYEVSAKRLAIFRLGNAINPIHFIDPELRVKFDFLSNFEIDETRPIVVCVSALEKRKIIEDALQAFALINKKKPCHMILLGSGTHENHYRQLAKELGIQACVTFAGMVGQVPLSNILAYSDVILSPLTGRALAEGMLSGTPVVAYDVDCHPDFIEDGINGFLVEYRNFHEMANRAIDLLSSHTLNRMLGKAGRITIQKMMNPQALIIEQRNHLEKLFD